MDNEAVAHYMTKHRHTEFVPLIAELMKLFKPRVYCEVGVQHGFTFNQLAPLAGLAVAVDINPMPHVKPARNVQTFIGLSHEFVNYWAYQKKPIDLLFIDADHNPRVLLNDLISLGQFVPAATGLILLHDTYPIIKKLESSAYCHKAWQVADLVHRHEGIFKDHEIVTLPGPWAGLSILRRVPDGHFHEGRT